MWNVKFWGSGMECKFEIEPTTNNATNPKNYNIRKIKNYVMDK